MSTLCSPFGSLSSCDSSLAVSIIDRYVKLSGHDGIVAIQSLFISISKRDDLLLDQANDSNLYTASFCDPVFQEFLGLATCIIVDDVG